MKTSKVLVAQFNRTYEGQYGTMYVHQIVFENGESGEYNSKSQEQNKFIVGQEANYELTPNANPQYAPKIKPVNPEYAGGKGGGGRQMSPEQQASIEKQVCLKVAAEVVEKGSKPEVVIAHASRYYDWLSGKTGEMAQRLVENEKTGIPGVTDQEQPPF